jgi:hypothetical protein
MAQLASLLRTIGMERWLDKGGSTNLVELLQDPAARSDKRLRLEDRPGLEDPTDLDDASLLDLLVPVGRRSPILRCVNCPAPTGGATYPYCYSCYIKSRDPKGGVAPILPPLRVPKDE